MPALPARRTAGLFLGALAVVAAATLAVHGPAVASNLHRHHWEDRRFFRHNRAEIHSPLDCFTHGGAWPGLYRPLTTNCYYLAGRTLWGDRIEVYHAVNLAVYLACGVLVFWIARFLVGAPLALLAGALWASRLAQWQTLLYTSEFQGLLSTLLALFAIGCAVSTRTRATGPRPPWWRGEAAGLVAFALALLSKESAVAVPAIVSAATWIFAPQAWRRDGAWWAIAVGWAVLFAAVLRGLAGTPDTGYVYDAAPGAVAHRYAGYLLMFGNGAVDRLDVAGVPVAVPLMAHVPWVFVPIAVAGAALALLFACARALPPPRAAGARGMALGAAWFLAATAPFVVLDDRLFLRYSVFGNAGLAVLLASVPLAAFGGRVLSAPAAADAARSPKTAPAPP